MDPTVFLLDSEALTPMRATAFASEAVLQEALARFPDLVAGPTTAGGDPAPLLLVRREQAVPDRPDGPGAFALDHLFLDADGVPVLVEVKRSSDTRIRREVVGQMLDYVANATEYWDVGKLRADVDGTAVAAHATGSPEEFWAAVEQNLRAGRVRLVFVADHLPERLVRVIEFLNGQMSPAEVLGVELRQFTGSSGGPAVIVPRVVGRTSTAVRAKAPQGRRWDREGLLEEVDRTCPTALDLVERLLADVEAAGGALRFGTGATAGVTADLPLAGDLPAGDLHVLWRVLTGTGEAPDPPRLELQVRPLFPLLGEAEARDRLDRVAARLAGVPAVGAKLLALQARGWDKQFVKLALADLAPVADEVLAAVEGLRRG